MGIPNLSRDAAPCEIFVEVFCRWQIEVHLEPLAPSQALGSAAY